eukprot:1610729-Alexandrium_andersonii.AAC.1
MPPPEDPLISVSPQVGAKPECALTTQNLAGCVMLQPQAQSPIRGLPEVEPRPDGLQYALALQ